MIEPYLVAVAAALFSALSAFTLSYAVRHLDPAASAQPHPAEHPASIGV